MADGDNAAYRSPGATGGSGAPGREPVFDYPRDAKGFAILKSELREATWRLPGRVAKVAAYLIDACANAEHFYDTGSVVVWPAMSTIAAETRMCERTAQRAIGDLMEDLALVPTGFSRKRVGRHWVRFESDGRCGSGITVEYAWSPAWLRNRLAEIRAEPREQPSLALPIEGGRKSDRPGKPKSAASRAEVGGTSPVLRPEVESGRVTTVSGKGDNPVAERVTDLPPYSLDRTFVSDAREGEDSEKNRQELERASRAPPRVAANGQAADERSHGTLSQSTVDILAAAAKSTDLRRASHRGPNFADPAVRKQQWQGDVFQEIVRTESQERAAKLLELYWAGDPVGIAAFEEASARIKAARARAQLA